MERGENQGSLGFIAAIVATATIAATKPRLPWLSPRSMSLSLLETLLLLSVSLA